MDAAPRSPAHEIVRALWVALRALEPNVRARDVERWGLAVHGALASTARQFHSHEHVMELAEGATPLETIAALYHDVVYVQVDGELPASMAELLAPLLERTSGGWRIRDAATHARATRLVLDVFGRAPGDVLGPLSGLNELASALAFALHLGRVLTEDHVIAVAACIEATIPFRVDPGAELAPRLRALALSEAKVKEHVERAMRVANRDVANFGDEDPANFLANTWKLLPETNPSLHAPTRYTVGDYRVALMKMETFLERLPPERVFHVWGDEPSAEEHRARVERARRNIAVAVRYLRIKLYAIAVVEALCLETGGDLPLQYVMGAMSPPGKKNRLESFLPPPDESLDVDPLLLGLLSRGRAGASSFDIAPSPLATHLLRALGEAAIAHGVAEARTLWSGAIAPGDFLRMQRGDVVASLATAAAAMAETRRDALNELAARAAPRPKRPSEPDRERLLASN